jgi:hypothetical protein
MSLEGAEAVVVPKWRCPSPLAHESELKVIALVPSGHSSPSLNFEADWARFRKALNLFGRAGVWRRLAASFLGLRTVAKVGG